MTGGTSGIGRRVLERLLRERPNWVIILIARPSPRVDVLKALRGADRQLAVIDGDLASLNSVDRACDEVVGTPRIRSMRSPSTPAFRRSPVTRPRRTASSSPLRSTSLPIS
jgi:NAD(P)-dependent dehydrogenase (short-subunit alcohol dehydrogenase family)